MRPQQHFHAPVGQASARDIIHHHHVCPLWRQVVPPPDDPHVATCCPQCGKHTWRHTRLCIHCRLDLVAWRSRARWAAIGRALLWLPRAVLRRAAPRPRG